jgi:1,4-alpha-glucan branching enzyme
MTDSRSARLERFARGEEFRLWEVLGAHPVTRDGAAGVRFAVWAPAARRVEVVGDFNRWEAGSHPLSAGEGGVWETFVPGVPRGSIYKYLIHTRLGGRQLLKADPLAFASEPRPRTGSVVLGLDEPAWHDAGWMSQRARRQRADRPISIYEVHLGSWKRWPAAIGETGEWRSYADVAGELVRYACEQGHTHLELLPITEHPFDGSWGYQATAYFAPTSRFGAPEDFRRLVDTAHQAGLGVILDWVPAHFPRDAHGLGFFDGTPLYELTDPRRSVHPDWDTYVFDFGKPEVVSFLVSSAMFWLERFHVDGLRVDAVASMIYLDYSRHPEEWTPNVKGGRENLEAVGFVRKLNEAVHAGFPGVLTFAEESTSWPGVTAAVADGGLGFDFKWNMGWMNDTLTYFRTDPIERSKLHEKLTFSLTYAFDEKYILPLSHDEVVHEKASLLSKMPGERRNRFANVRAMLGWMIAHPGKKLLFMGGEIGQWREWNHDAELDWYLLESAPHRELQLYVRELTRFYASRPELWERDTGWDGFEWIDCADEALSILALIRRAKDRRHLVIVLNFTPVTRKAYRIGVPGTGGYVVAFQSDDPRYGGTGVQLPRSIAVEDVPWHGRDRSIAATLPPLSALFLEPTGAEPEPSLAPTPVAGSPDDR